MDLICELGATTIRLAHYQHDQYFYDLCDERGMVVWAEIPYISTHMPNGRENTISQMKELVVQNYNHPSIIVWGLSNEITMHGDSDEDLRENHVILNDLVHEMDKTRLDNYANWVELLLIHMFKYQIQFHITITSDGMEEILLKMVLGLMSSMQNIQTYQ